MSVIRVPIVAIAFVFEQLKRLPGAGFVRRYGAPIVIALSLLAGVAFLVWGFERAPQRLSLAQLAAGELSPLQSWIIISGDLRAESSQPSRNLYRLTDPQAPSASMIVVAAFDLPLGRQTISGQYTGTRVGVPAGFNFVGYMEAEPVLAQEQAPPWIAIGLASVALLLFGSSRTTYPTFFRESPGRTERATRDIPVRIHSNWPASSTDVETGTLVFPVDGPVQLHRPDEAALELRLHSAHTSADVGELRSLRDAEPALVLRPATGEIMLGFDSRADRDATFMAVVADAQRDVPAMVR